MEDKYPWFCQVYQPEHIWWLEKENDRMRLAIANNERTINRLTDQMKRLKDLPLHSPEDSVG